MADSIELINDIYYSDRRLFNIKNPDNSISVGYLTPQQPNDAGKIINLEGVGNIAILGSFSANSRNYNPGQLSLDEASLTNGNNRISNAIFGDPNYYSLITKTTTESTQSNDASGTEGFGDSTVSRATVSSPTGSKLQNTFQDSVVRYPLNINQNQDYVKFNVVKLATRSLGDVGGINGTLTANKYDEVKNANPGYVIIGTQAPIYDRSSVGWGDDGLNALQLAGANVSVKMATGDAQNAMDTFNTAWNDLGAQINQEQNGIAGILGAMAVGLNPSAVFSRTQRKIINPNLELLFSGPALRPFNFTFKFAAREIDEARNIKKIIKFFKQNMVPRVDKTGNGLFLESPHVFTIQYMNGSKGIHKSINLISDSPTTKACALISCDVNYTPLGTYMTFDDDDEATMVAYELNMQFQEIEPIYSKDYDESPGQEHSIGY